MKSLLILITGILLLSACQKKSPKTNTYFCVQTDSVSAANPTHVVDSGYVGHYTSDMINFYEKQHSSIDTVKKGGVTEVDYYVTTCVIFD